MSASTLAHPPHHRAALTKFWVAVAILVAIAIGLAWLGAGSLRGERTETGLVFRTVEAGTGPYIDPRTDAVLVEYELRLEDGTVIDSSASHGGPQPFMPGQSLIPGFTEALGKMQKGGRYRFKVPPELGYGTNPPPGIPAGQMIEFDVHVVDVAPNAAAAMAAEAQAQAQQQGVANGEAPQGR